MRLGDLDLLGAGPTRSSRWVSVVCSSTRRSIAELSVLDNLLVACHRRLDFSVFAEMIGLPAVRRAEDDARAGAREVASPDRPRGSLDMLTGRLPYGYRKLLELGRVILIGARTLLLDEPIAGLNEREIEHLAELVLGCAPNAACRSCSSSTTWAWCGAFATAPSSSTPAR